MIGSAWYWAFVAALTVGVALLDIEAFRRRSMSRAHGAAVVLSVVTFIVTAGIASPLGPLGGAIFWIVPVAVRIGAAVVYFGAVVIAESVTIERCRVRRRVDDQRAKHLLTPAELRVAEAYDDRWQREDRMRNRAWAKLRSDRTRASRRGSR